MKNVVFTGFAQKQEMIKMKIGKDVIPRTVKPSKQKMIHILTPSGKYLYRGRDKHSASLMWERAPIGSVMETFEGLKRVSKKLKRYPSKTIVPSKKVKPQWEVVYRTMSGKTKRKVVEASNGFEAWKKAVKEEKEMIDFEISRKRLIGSKKIKSDAGKILQ